MKGHEFVIACQLNKAPPRAVFVDFSGPADPTLPIPVVVASPSDRLSLGSRPKGLRSGNRF